MNDITQLLTGFGGLAVFIVVFADQAGLPIPAPPVLLAAGSFVAAKKLDVGLALGMAVLAAMLADSLWFCLGRKGGTRALPVVGRWARAHNLSFAHTKNVVSRHGLWTLTVAKFLPGTVMPSLAGALGMSVRQFLLFDGLAALFYAGCYLCAGFIFQNQIQQAMVWFDRVGHGIFGLGAIIAVGYVIYKYALWRKNRLQKVHLNTGRDNKTDLVCKNVVRTTLPSIEAANRSKQKDSNKHP